MDTGEKFFLVIVCLLLVFVIIEDILLIISWSKAKEKVFVSNWLSFLSTIFFGLCICLPNYDTPISILYLICLILTIPCQFTCLSPEGIRTAFKKGGLIPVENLSYEYTKTKFGIDILSLYDEVKSRPSTYNIGIKNPKTVKMLADWYGKHGYENPLTK